MRAKSSKMLRRFIMSQFNLVSRHKRDWPMAARISYRALKDTWDQIPVNHRGREAAFVRANT